jgi:hypothetical protein
MSVVNGSHAAEAACEEEDAPSTPTGCGSTLVATTQGATTTSASEGESSHQSGDEAHCGGSSYPSSDTAAGGEGSAGGDGGASEAAVSAGERSPGGGAPPPVTPSPSGPTHHRGGQDALRTVFVGGLPPWGDEGSVAWFFSALGPLSHVKLIRDPVTGLSKRYAFVTFMDPATAQAVKACQRLDFFGKLVDLGEPAAAGGQPGGRGAAGGGYRVHGAHRGLRAGAPAAASVPVSHRVFVGGLPRDATEAQLTQFFGRFGPVVEFRIIYDAVSGQSKGFGFASFVSKGDADDMKARKSVMYANRPLNLGVARLSAANAHAAGGDDVGGGSGGGGRKGGIPPITNGPEPPLPRGPREGRDWEAADPVPIELPASAQG